MNSKKQNVTRKIIFAIFLVINLGIFDYFLTKLPCLMQFITMLSFATFSFALESSVSAGELVLAIIIFISEIICLPSLFTGKSKYKLVCNIILQIMCIADIGFCLNLVFKQNDITFHIFESIIDLLFMGLVLYDLSKVYNIKLNKIFKNKKLCKPKSEQNEAQ